MNQIIQTHYGKILRGWNALGVSSLNLNTITVVSIE